MKKYLTFIIVLVCFSSSAQNINDVLRYSREDIQGTARFQGLSGAFGALGGDLSALNVNPAGSAVFNNSQFTISGSNYNRDNDALYFNSTNNTTLNALEINQAGGVFVFKSTDENANWKKLSLAVNYDLVNNFDNEFFVSGNSNQGIDAYFLGFVADPAAFEGKSVELCFSEIVATDPAVLIEEFDTSFELETSDEFSVGEWVSVRGVYQAEKIYPTTLIRHRGFSDVGLSLIAALVFVVLMIDMKQITGVQRLVKKKQT